LGSPETLVGGDSGVDFLFCFLRGGEGRGEVVEPGVGAATGRFCDNVGEQWALPVLGVVCAVSDHALVGVEGASDNISALEDAASEIGDSVGGASGSMPVLCDVISVSGVSVAVATAFHL
jgi:hypothetical protein